MVGWIPLCGLKVLRPQEALVLTLFGKYLGTLKGDGFYWVNPFCTAFNPAASTKLRQRGDVRGVLRHHDGSICYASSNAWRCGIYNRGCNTMYRVSFIGKEKCPTEDIPISNGIYVLLDI